MIRCGKTGAVLLHGTGCVRCDCGGAIDPLFQRKSDETLTRALQDDAWARAKRQQDEAIMSALFGRSGVTDPPWHFNCRSTAGSHWRDTATRAPVEIITDPADTRGMNARRVGP